MNVTELIIAGDFEIPDASVDGEIDLVLRVRVYSLERVAYDVAGFDAKGTGANVDGGLYVRAMAVPGWPEPAEAPAPIAPDYAESAE